MADETALRDLRNVLVVVGLDGELTDSEQDFLDQLCTRLGISEKEFESLQAEVDGDSKRLSVPRGPEGEQVLSLLVEAAVADGHLDDRERSVLGKVARFVGVSEAALEQLLSSAIVSDEQQRRMELQVEELYTSFAQWDESTRQQKMQALSENGSFAVRPLLNVMESYRTPEGTDGLGLKAHVARQLGQLGDPRSIYYLAQQISLGDMDDEITNQALRESCVAAIGQIVGESFGEGQPSVEAARTWWNKNGRGQYDQLSL